MIAQQKGLDPTKGLKKRIGSLNKKALANRIGTLGWALARLPSDSSAEADGSGDADSTGAGGSPDSALRISSSGVSLFLRSPVVDWKLIEQPKHLFWHPRPFYDCLGNCIVRVLLKVPITGSYHC